MASQVDICNRALTLLGANLITSMTQGIEEARRCNANYTTALEELLEEFNWPWATFPGTLSPLSSTPDFSWGYQYQLPTSPKFIRRIKVMDAGENDIDFEIQGDKLLCNEDEAVCLEYIGYVDNPLIMPPKVREALAYKIASILAYPLTKSRTLQADMVLLYRDALKAAKVKQAETVKEPAQPEDPWILARQ